MQLFELFKDLTIIKHTPKHDLWFRHQSPLKLDVLKPQTYKYIGKNRPEYNITTRINTEKPYHKLLGTASNQSFLYATIVGYNKMTQPSEYPGYTYFFKLDKQQLKNTIFTIVAKDTEYPLATGQHGLEYMMTQYKKHLHEFKTSKVDGILIYPRVEVIIPYSVDPLMVINQEEDR
jgi:hypothetical protein